MKAIGIILLVVTAAFILTGCGGGLDRTLTTDDKYKLCLGEGGSFESGGDGSYKCTMPGGE